MFLKLMNLRKTIFFKLVFVYSLIIAISLTFSFFTIYSFFEAYLDSQVKKDLIETAKWADSVYKKEGLKELIEQIKREAEVIDERELFYKIYDKNGNIILSTNTAVHTKDIALKLEDAGILKKGNFVIKKIDYFYVIFYKLSDKYTFVVGESILDNNKMLNKLQEIFYISGIIAFLLSFFASVFTTFIFVKKLRKISDTAKAISSTSSLDKRIPVKYISDEVDELAILLNQSFDKIETLIKSIKETSENIAHDLKTPIARIRSSAELLLLEEKLDKKCADTVVYIIEETDRLNSMIVDLLTISKLESGAYILKKEKINLSSILQNLYELFKNYAKSKGINLQADIQENIFIEGDTKYISRAVSNLIDNAIKFNKPNGKVIISLKEEDEKIILSITDTGIGIPEDKIDKIFDKFYQVDESRSISGSGLGLSLVKVVLEKHNAKLDIFSKEGEGTNIVITFPKITNL
ncbi:HAMP domain-containing sensor histidine kinase [Venenivibrio stagnispumantis]|uniref:histidine kinase n=2 Tax=Venenivibrio stagnispumantis TaxID=407998 RepID=A0AA45WMB2_9AQUI|nr:HAMP domain-containing histidine kinase [Venenivibrio stagnispumantis]SMP13783.1 Signal transduction histidine kinase [Venenivibrio stagnispumantis]